MAFLRSVFNPILKPNKYQTWEDRAVFNPGATLFGGKFYLLYRAIGEYSEYISTVGLAISEDGIHFERFLQPVLVPEESYEKFGIEDLRINCIEGKFYLTHTILSRPATQGGTPHQVGLIETLDFKNFLRRGPITPKYFCSRNAVLFSEKIKGKYVLLHRPLYLTQDRYNNQEYPLAPGIWISYSNDLLHWSEHSLLMEPKENWEEEKIGAGPPPIKTNKGWLLIYHGMDKKHTYKAGAAILDLENPQKVLYRTKEPILSPEMPYEKEGDVPNVVFPTGLVEKEGILYLYYGAADKTVCLATASLEEFLNSLV